MSQKTVKIVRKFCEMTMMPYNQTLRNVRSMRAEDRSKELRAMKELVEKIKLEQKEAWAKQIQGESEMPVMATSPQDIQ